MRVRPLALPVMAAGLLALTSCTAVMEDTDSTASPGTGGSSPTASPTSSPSPTASADAECLEGEWEGDLRAAERSALQTLQLGELQVEPEVETSGESWVTFEDDTMTTEYREQSTTVTLTPADSDQELVATMTLDGTTTGSYTVEGDTLTVTDLDLSDLTTQNTAQLGGQEYELPGLEDVQADTLPVDTEFTFECSEDELRLTPVVDDVPTPAQTEGAPGTEDVQDALTQVLTRR